MLNLLALAAGCRDGDGSAGHVEFSVSGVVDPSPAQQNVVTLRGVGGNSEVESRISWASTLLGVDDSPSITAVVTQRELARSAVVGSTTLKSDSLLRARSPSCDGRSLISTKNIQCTLAREGLCGVGRSDVVVHRLGIGVALVLQRRRRSHVHVSIGHGSKGCDDEAGGEMHLARYVAVRHRRVCCFSSNEGLANS